MALTGRSDGPPLGPPRHLVATLDATAAGIVAGDPLVLLAERAALGCLRRQSPASCGGASRLLPCADGWAALSLARPTDVELLAAWLEVDPRIHASQPASGSGRHDSGPDEDLWEAVATALASRPAEVLRDRAALLGLPAAVVGGDAAIEPVVRTCASSARDGRGPAGALVIDLGSLWAGPLCGQILAAHGARVVKVESSTRPDGARTGNPAFFDLLNGTKRSVAVDLTAASGVAVLGALLAVADVVIEASRPRALAQLGFDADSMAAGGWTGVWTSITGYGRTGDAAGRVAFGDDAAAAGGLVVHEDDEPRFCADAVADPLTGVTAAASTLDALATPGTWLLDVRMAGVAASAAGETLAVADTVTAAPPRARPVTAAAPALGADTAAVLAELGIDP